MSKEVINIGGFSIQGSEDGKIDTFETGCVRDTSEGKGMCSLVSPIAIDKLLRIPFEEILEMIEETKENGIVNTIYKQYIHWMFTGQDIAKVVWLSMMAQHRRITGEYTTSNVPPMGLIEVSKLYEAGSIKYDAHNWTKGMKVTRCMDSLYRHLLKLDAQWEDEAHDTAVCWNAIAILHYEVFNTDMCDNYWVKYREQFLEYLALPDQ